MNNIINKIANVLIGIPILVGCVLSVTTVFYLIYKLIVTFYISGEYIELAATILIIMFFIGVLIKSNEEIRSIWP